MLIFIFLNLSISFLLKTESPLYTLLVSDYSLYLGVFLLIGSLVSTGFKFRKIPFKFRYDLFATGSLLIWICYWPPFFRPHSPIFENFPLYFAFISAFFTLEFNTKAKNIDPDSLKVLQWLSDSGRFNPMVIMIAISISLVLPEQFLLFPVTITIFISRYALANCLNNE